MGKPCLLQVNQKSQIQLTCKAFRVKDDVQSAPLSGKVKTKQHLINKKQNKKKIALEVFLCVLLSLYLGSAENDVSWPLCVLAIFSLGFLSLTIFACRHYLQFVLTFFCV